MTYTPGRSLTPFKLFSVLAVAIVGLKGITIREEINSLKIEIDVSWWSVLTFGLLARYVRAKVQKILDSLQGSVPQVEITKVNRRKLW